MAGTELGDYLRGCREQARLTQREVGEKVGIHWTSVQKIEAGERKMARKDSRDVLVRIAQVVGADTLRTLQLAGHEPRDDVVQLRRRPEFREYIMGDKRLTVDQKRLLIAAYEGFVGRSPD